MSTSMEFLPSKIKIIRAKKPLLNNPGPPKNRISSTCYRNSFYAFLGQNRTLSTESSYPKVAHRCRPSKKKKNTGGRNWIYSPPSNSSRFRFMPIPYEKCNNPHGDCLRGRVDTRNKVSKIEDPEKCWKITIKHWPKKSTLQLSKSTTFRMLGYNVFLRGSLSMIATMSKLIHQSCHS